MPRGHSAKAIFASVKPYVATTSTDLAVSREVSPADIATYDRRKEIGRDLISELGEYFGFRLNDGAFTAHLDYVERLMDVGD